jgi:hypothetical protein
LRERADITLVFAAMDDAGRYYHEHKAIAIAKDLTQAQRRSALAHELVHAERGDTACCSDWHAGKQERRVEGTAARRLISSERLVDALLWADDERELADVLWVDVEMVRARLAGLSESEKRDIEERLWAAERLLP